MVTAVRRAAISDAEADRSRGAGDGRGAQRQRKAGQRDEHEDRAPHEIERGEEFDVALHGNFRRPTGPEGRSS